MSKGKTPEEMIPKMGEPEPVGLFAWLRGRFFAGIIVTAPLVATFIALRFLIEKIDEFVKPLLPAALKPETYTQFAIPGFGLLVLVSAGVVIARLGLLLASARAA